MPAEDEGLVDLTVYGPYGSAAEMLAVHAFFVAKDTRSQPTWQRGVFALGQQSAAYLVRLEVKLLRSGSSMYLWWRRSTCAALHPHQQLRHSAGSWCEAWHGRWLLIKLVRGGVMQVSGKPHDTRLQVNLKSYDSLRPYVFP